MAPNDESEVRKQMRERFWRRVQEVIGVLPVRVMGLLDLFNLSASQNIADAKTDWVKIVEKEVKEKGDKMFDYAVEQGFTRSKRDVFGLDHNNLGAFSLLAAEKVSINDIQKLIQQNGIRTYITASPARGTNRRVQANSSAGALTPAQQKKILLDKLANYYRKHRVGISSSFFVDLAVETVQESVQCAVVSVPCPKCDTKVMCTRNGNTWMTSNYYQHGRTHSRREAEVRSSQRGTSRRSPRLRNRRRRSSTVEPANEERESGESSQDSPTLVSTTEERGESTKQQQNLTASGDEDKERGEDASPQGRIVEQAAAGQSSIVVDHIAEQAAAGSGDGAGESSIVVDLIVEQTAGSGDGAGQSSKKKSVTELIDQFSGEGMSSHSFQKSSGRILRSRNTSEN